MWQNYMIVGFRALIKNRTYAFINIVGLAIGLAACLMLLVYVRYETTYDQWLPNAENTYQFQTHFRNKQTGEEDDLQMTAYVSGQRLEHDFPQVERSVYALSSEPVVQRNGQALPTKDVLLVDDLFFDVLRFPLVQRKSGDRPVAARHSGHHPERGAAAVRPRGCGRPDSDHGLARHLDRLSDRRHRPRPAAQQPCPLHHGGADRHPDLLSRDAHVHDQLGLAVGLVLFQPPPGRRPGGDPGGAAGLGAAQYRGPGLRQTSAPTPATIRTGGWSTSATSTSAGRSRRR